MKAEQAIERHLCKRIREKGGICIKLTEPAGIPDRLAILPDGRNIYIELKAECGILSPIQKAIHRRLREMNQTVLTLWNFEEVDEFIAKL